MHNSQVITPCVGLRIEFATHTTKRPLMHRFTLSAFGLGASMRQDPTRTHPYVR